MAQALEVYNITSGSPDWPAESLQVQNGMRTQRDIMQDIPIDQVPMIGVNLGKVLFNNMTGKSNSTYDEVRILKIFYSLMSSHVQVFVLDLEYRDEAWYVQETPILFSKLLTVVSTYLDQTNSALFADIVTFLINFRTSHGPSQMNHNSQDHITFETNVSSKGITEKMDIVTLQGLNSSTVQKQSNNLTYIMDTFLGSNYIYTPADLELNRGAGLTSTIDNFDTRRGWPTLSTFLFQLEKRILFMELSNSAERGLDTNYVFPQSVYHYDQGNSTLMCPTTLQEFDNITNISWKYLETEFTAPEVYEYWSCGSNPILANSFDVNNITKILPIFNSTVLWSWKYNEPRNTYKMGKLQREDQEAYNCAVLTYQPNNWSISWEVANCYSAYQGLCGNENEPFKWYVTDRQYTFFDLESYTGNKCPDHYKFGLPKTPLEERALALYLNDNPLYKNRLWIELNAITTPDCWVTGGPFVNCPYERVVSTRSFIGYLVPISICAFLLMVNVLYLGLIRIPIYDNRKNWRKVIAKATQLETEGVPL